MYVAWSHLQQAMKQESMLLVDAYSMMIRMQESLSAWPGIKDVHPEQQVKRALTWDDSSSGSSDQQPADSEWASKRPGR